SKLVQQKLRDYGLSPEETMARVNKLSDEQINQLATHTDSLQAGGDPVDLAIGLLILALLVVLLIYLLQGRIVIK
ncbi:MAG TPA: PA2779 family protein, partial [Nitrospirota bacterium]|nr:PA2779 family protein [Nitrospirota bacterium]